MDKKEKLSFEKLLEIGREQLLLYKKVRECFPSKITLSKTRNSCIWCQDGKRENFLPEDLEETDSDWCRYCVMSGLEIPYDTGFEPHLINDFDVFYQINNFVYTTASAIEGSEECIYFYAPRSLQSFLKQHLAEYEVEIEECSECLPSRIKDDYDCSAFFNNIVEYVIIDTDNWGNLYSKLLRVLQNYNGK